MITNNQYYFIASPSNSSINGEIIISNNIYSDTLIINESINTYPSTIIDLGNDTVTCSYSVITLDALENQQTYLWSTGAVSQSIDVNNTDSYWVEITNLNNCKSLDTIHVVFLDCTFIKENEENSKLAYYQNNKFEVVTDLKNYTVNIYSLTGKLILNTQNQNSILINHLNNGVYIVTFNGLTSQSKKFIINK